MAESEQAKAHRLQQLREKRRLKREQTSDTPQAEAERRKQVKEYDEGAVKKSAERGVILS